MGKNREVLAANIGGRDKRTFNDPVPGNASKNRGLFAIPLQNEQIFFFELGCGYFDWNTMKIALIMNSN